MFLDESMMKDLKQSKEFLIEIQATLSNALAMKNVLNDMDMKFKKLHDYIRERQKFFQEQAVNHQKILESIEALNAFNKRLLEASRSSVQLVTAKLERVESKQILMSKRKEGISSAANTATSIVEWLTVRIDEHKKALNKMIADVRLLVENQRTAALRTLHVGQPSSKNRDGS